MLIFFFQSIFILSNCVFIFVISCLRILSILCVGEGDFVPRGDVWQSLHMLSAVATGGGHCSLASTVQKPRRPSKPERDTEQPPTAKDCPLGSD